MIIRFTRFHVRSTLRLLGVGGGGIHVCGTVHSLVQTCDGSLDVKEQGDCVAD